jgi:hypothetical protein
MPREDRILSQSEIDSLLKKIAPDAGEPAAEDETPQVEPEPVEPTAAPEETTAPSMKTVSFKSIESGESEKAAPAGPVTDSIKMSEHKPEAAKPPASAQSLEIDVQKRTSGDVDEPQKKITEPTAEMSKLTAALQTISQLEERVRRLEAAVKNIPESTRALKDRVDKISAAIEAVERNKSDYGFLEAFRCNHCHSIGNVAVYVKCTSCGKENWMGWWPEKEKK